MAIPYDLYIRYLATKGFDDLSLMNEEISKFSLRPISQLCFDQHWDMVAETLPKGILSQIQKKLYGPDFEKHMAILEVKDLWDAMASKASRRALEDIHADPALRLTINALLVKGLKIEEISRLVNTKFTAALKETHVELYMRYFFNPRRMRRSDWKSYLSDASIREKNIIFMALTESIDTVKTELDLPAQISVSDTLQWLITKSFARAKLCMNAGTPETSQEARSWIDKIVQLSDKYEKYRSADQQDFAKSLQMEFDFLEDDFDSPDGEMLSEIESTKSRELEGKGK